MTVLLSLVSIWTVSSVTSLPVLFTTMLAMGALGSSVLAYLVFRETGRADLEEMHREIDRTRGLVRAGMLSDQEIERHLSHLRRLQESLPKDDLRRT